MAAPTGEFTNSVVRMATGFFFLFMAFNTTQALETTLLSDQTLAYATLGVLYGVFTMTAIIAPKIVDLMGPRLGMTFGGIFYVLLVFANIAPSYGTLIPASAGVGFGAGLLWTSQGIYMSRCAVRESAATGQSVELVTSRLNGIFWTMFQSNAAVGLILSSIILGKANDGVFSLSDAVKYMFIGFGAIGCAGVFILSTLKNAPAFGTSGGSATNGNENNENDPSLNNTANNDDDDEESASAKAAAGAASGGATLKDTLRLMWSSRAMQLLLPAIFYCGASLGFFGATFPLIYQDPDAKSGIFKLLPASYVGYQAATFYATNSFFSYLWGRTVPVIGRRVLFLVTFVTAIGFFALIALYSAGVFTIAHGSAEAYVFVFSLAIVFAAGDSVLESQLPAILQSPTFFPVERDRDAANAVLRMVQSLGFCAQFGIGIAFPCKDGQSNCRDQAGILLPLLVIALICIWICDKFVKPIETKGGNDKSSGEYSALGTTSSDD